jgi:flap endonuclease-1
MDTLTFGTPVLLKHLTFSEAKRMPVAEVNLTKALEGFGMEMDQFIDLCILLGCDYMDSIKGMGPKTALKLIREHKTIEGVLEHIKESGKKMVVPDIWPYEEARAIFRKPDVKTGSDVDIKWEAPDVEGLVQFMCGDRGFNEDRIRKGAEKLQKSLGQKQQGRLDSFFTVKSTQPPKRKPEEEKKPSKKSKKK